MRNFIICLNIFFIHLSLQQYDSGRIVELKKTPTIAKILSSSDPNNPHIILGYRDG
jgi:hypothetical protein